MATDTFDIQELINASGVSRRTIYFYVQQGLLPPPQGAGLAAHYTPAHLLRLQLIPVLRRQGLRLDEIRTRFQHMTDDEMRQALTASSPPANDFSPPGATAISPPSPDQLRQLPGDTSPPGAYPAGQRYLHYAFPGGITLTAPENLSAAERARLDQLLQAARQIYSVTPLFAEHRPGHLPDNGSSDPQEV
jgi:DNA-binding transcriptional MerR regulator